MDDGVAPGAPCAPSAAVAHRSDRVTDRLRGGGAPSHILTPRADGTAHAGLSPSEDRSADHEGTVCRARGVRRPPSDAAPEPGVGQVDERAAETPCFERARRPAGPSPRLPLPPPVSYTACSALSRRCRVRARPARCEAATCTDQVRAQVRAQISAQISAQIRARGDHAGSSNGLGRRTSERAHKCCIGGPATARGVAGAESRRRGRRVAASRALSRRNARRLVTCARRTLATCSRLSAARSWPWRRWRDA